MVPTVPGLVKLTGGLIFPVGLTLVILSGTELFTGNTAVVPMSVFEGQVRAVAHSPRLHVARLCTSLCGQVVQFASHSQQDPLP